MNDLLVALAKRDLNGALRLLEADFEVNFRDSDGRTALMHAAMDGKGEFLDLLIRFGADINASDKNGFTALHFAAQEFQVACAKTLLDAGALVDSQDRFGNTPLWRATFSSRGRGEMITLLLERGANPGTKNLSGNSPVDLADTIANYDLKHFFGK
jgi:ankyrin repeat protein